MEHTEGSEIKAVVLGFITHSIRGLYYVVFSLLLLRHEYIFFLTRNGIYLSVSFPMVLMGNEMTSICFVRDFPFRKELWDQMRLIAGKCRMNLLPITPDRDQKTIYSPVHLKSGLPILLSLNPEHLET